MSDLLQAEAQGLVPSVFLLGWAFKKDPMVLFRRVDMRVSWESLGLGVRVNLTLARLGHGHTVVMVHIVVVMVRHELVMGELLGQILGDVLVDPHRDMEAMEAMVDMDSADHVARRLLLLLGSKQ